MAGKSGENLVYGPLVMGLRQENLDIYVYVCIYMYIHVRLKKRMRI